MLPSGDISVVLAGPVSEYTSQTVSAARTVLPDAELILSSWRGTIPAGLDVDLVIENDDPGSVSGRNTNRMLRSARQGLAAASRPYALKLRTDAQLTGTGFADWWQIDPPRFDRFPIFSRRIITLNIAVRPSGREPGLLFHPSDCVHFGDTADLQRLWNTPEIDERANFEHHGCGHGPGARGPKYANEQALWIGCLRAAGYPVDYCAACGTTASLRAESDLSLVNNFLVLEPWQFCVELPKLRYEVLSLGAVSIRMWLADWRRVQTRFAHDPVNRPLTAGAA
jgi:hypothetical protein